MRERFPRLPVLHIADCLAAAIGRGATVGAAWVWLKEQTWFGVLLLGLADSDKLCFFALSWFWRTQTRATPFPLLRFAYPTCRGEDVCLLGLLHRCGNRVGPLSMLPRQGI